MEVDRHYSKEEVEVVNANLKKEMAPWLRVPELKSVPNSLQ